MFDQRNNKAAGKVAANTSGKNNGLKGEEASRQAE